MSAIQKLIDKLTADGKYSCLTHAARVEHAHMVDELKKLYAAIAGYAEIVADLQERIDEMIGGVK